MKKLLALLLASCVMLTCLVGCSSDEEDNSLQSVLDAGVLTMVTSPDYAPYEFVDPNQTGDDQYVGADIEFGKYIAEQLGVEFELIALDFDSVLTSVQTNKYDIAVAGFSYMPSREESVLMSDSYNAASGYQGVVIAEDSGITSIEDLAGETVVVQVGTLQAEIAEMYLQDSIIETVTKLTDAALMVESGKAVAFLAVSNVGEAFEISNEGLVMSTDIDFDIDEGLVVCMNLEANALCEAINEIIANMDPDLFDSWVEEAQELATSLGL